MESANPTKPAQTGMITVHVSGRYQGCLLPSVRGWRAFDHTDMELGSYDSQRDAVAALLAPVEACTNNAVAEGADLPSDQVEP
jgi:hypothetical protein